MPRGLNLLDEKGYTLPAFHPYKDVGHIITNIFNHLRHSTGGIHEDSKILLHTQTAYGSMMILGLIALAGALSPAQHISAEQDHTPKQQAALSGAVTSSSLSSPSSDAEGSSSSVTIEITPPVPPNHRAWSHRGVFLTPTSIGPNDYRTYTLDKLRDVGGNAIIFDVKGSAVHFDAENMPMAKELGLLDPKYSLKEVLDVLHERGIYAIARFIAVKDHSLAAKLPATGLKDPRTGSIISAGWIDPDNKDVLEYNRQIICALAKAGTDEINLDYIRFDTQEGAVMTAFTPQERITKIEAFVRMAREAIDSCGAHTKLGLSTFAILGWDHDVNAEAIGQDIIRFAPMVDVFSPMTYNANFSVDKYADPTGERGRWEFLVYRTVRGYRELLGKDAWKVRPWIQAWGVTEKDVRQQMQGAFDGGACGFIAWNADNAYEPVYSAMKKIAVPEECRGL